MSVLLVISLCGILHNEVKCVHQSTRQVYTSVIACKQAIKNYIYSESFYKDVSLLSKTVLFDNNELPYVHCKEKR